MATDAIDKTKLKDMIDHFYRFGGSPGWDGDINEATAEVFGMILREAYKCTDAVKLLPISSAPGRFCPIAPPHWAFLPETPHGTEDNRDPDAGRAADTGVDGPS